MEIKGYGECVEVVGSGLDGWMDGLMLLVFKLMRDKKILSRWRAQGNTVTPPGSAISRILITKRSALGLLSRKNLGLYMIKIKNNHTHWQLQ